jgi:CRISPR-associated endonuclease Csn1
VSHKADHGTQAALHNDTNYGKRGEPDKRGALPVSHRVPLATITSADKAQSIADPMRRAEVARTIDGLVGKGIKAALEAFAQRTGIRRVHVLEQLSVIPIHDRMTGNPYRYVKGDGNYCYEIWREDGRWNGEVITNFEANRKNQQLDPRKARNGKSLVMRIRKGDSLKLELDGGTRVMRVAKFSDGKINMTEHFEANVDARNRDPMISFGYLQKSPDALRKVATRAIGVDPLGYVNDPGFKE